MKGVEFNGFQEMRFEDTGFSYEPGLPRVFKSLNFEVPLGKNIYVTGEAGGGQSTLLKLIAVLVQPQEGRFFINDHDTTEMSFEEFLPIRMKIGYSFDFGGLFANRTLRENLTLPLLYHKIYSPEEAAERAALLAEEFGFSRQEHQRPAMVSGGLRKLICVLRAFVLKPELVALDDPFTGVGPEAARKLVQMVHEKRESGELKHVFLTSRDEFWMHELKCESLIVNRETIHFENKEAA